MKYYFYFIFFFTLFILNFNLIFCVFWLNAGAANPFYQRQAIRARRVKRQQGSSRFINEQYKELEALPPVKGAVLQNEYEQSRLNRTLLYYSTIIIPSFYVNHIILYNLILAKYL